MLIRTREGRGGRSRGPIVFGMGSAGGGSATQGPSVMFSADLTHTLVPDVAGSPTPTFTRATTAKVLAYAADAEVTDAPVFITVASGEARFMGARRISEGVWSSYDVNGVFLSTTNGASVLCCDADGPFGYLPEVARTNSALHSRKLAAGVVAGAWAESNITAADNATGVGGVANSCSTLTATANAGTILQAITLASAAAIFQPFVKRSVGTGTIEITLNGGTNWTDITAAVDAAAPDFYSLAAVTATLANPSIGYRLGTSGDAIIVDMNDCQNGTFRTSPIPTTTAAVTRNIDLLTFAGAGNVSTPFTIVCDLPQGAVNTGAVNVFFSAFTDGNNALIGYTNITTARGRAYVVTGGVEQADVAGTTDLVGTPATIAQVYATNGVRNYVNGVAEGTPDTSATMPAITTLGVGNYLGSVNATCAPIRFLKIYPQALTAAQIAAL